MAAGAQNPVPVIVGTTKNDGSFLVGRLYTRLAATNSLNNPVFLKTQLLPALYASFGL